MQLPQLPAALAERQRRHAQLHAHAAHYVAAVAAAVAHAVAAAVGQLRQLAGLRQLERQRRRREAIRPVTKDDRIINVEER